MQLVHNYKEQIQRGLAVAATALVILASTAPMAQAAEYINCRNTQITSYSPASGSDLGELDMIEYTVSEDTDVSTLEVSINKQMYPVQYRSLEDGGYRAFVMFPQDLAGAVYIDMHAESLSGDGCNAAISTSFVVDPQDEYTAYGVRETTYQPTYTPVVSTTPVNNTVANNTTSQTTQAGSPAVPSQGATVATTGGDGATDMTDETASTTATTSSSTDSELAQASSTGFVTQAASLFSALSGSDQAECVEGASQWPWYVWLGIIWLWLVAMWLLIGYTVEPIYGNDRYAKRLGITVALGTVAMLVLWWIASTCHTQFWVPVVLAILGIALYWLYSEDTSYPSDHNHTV